MLQRFLYDIVDPYGWNYCFIVATCEKKFMVNNRLVRTDLNIAKQNDEELPEFHFEDSFSDSDDDLEYSRVNGRRYMCDYDKEDDDFYNRRYRK